jgi:hypothetical protein
MIIAATGAQAEDPVTPVADAIENARLFRDLTARAEQTYDTFQLEADDDEPTFFDQLSLDLGVQRLGEVSRALTTDGVMRDIAGDGLSAPQFTVDGINGPLRVYQAEVAWNAAEAGPLRVSLLGGVRAFGISQGWSGVPGATVSLDDSGSDEIIPVTLVGGSIGLSLSDSWTLSGRATGQALDSGGSYFDLAAESAWSITPKLDLIAGYQFLEADVEGEHTGATLHSDGLYAQFKLRF